MKSEQYTNSNWGRIGGRYRKVVWFNGRLYGLEVWQEGSTEKPEVHVKIYSKREIEEETVKSFRLRIFRELGLNYNLNLVYEKLGEDEVAGRLIEEFFGLRLIRYINPEECLITYQLSANTTIKRLEQMVENVKQRFCRRFRFDDGVVLWEFPTIKLLAKLSLRELEECKLGYKAKFLFSLAKTLAKKPLNWRFLETANVEEARKILVGLPGVGLKVADAVLLYGLGRTETFPIDVWVRRALVRLYGLSQKSTYRKLQEFVRKRFGKFSGYLEPYLFYWSRSRRSFG